MFRLKLQDITWDIVNAIREKAATIPDFDHGAIRLLFVPKSNAAVEYFGGFGLDCKIDLGFTIKEGKSHIRPANWRDDITKEECDCYGYAALKIQGCDFAISNNFGRKSCDMPEEYETWGRTNDQGCVVYDISISNKFGIADIAQSKPFFRLFVAVSGATGYEDEQCARAAGNALLQWCNIERDDDGFGHFEKCLYLTEPA